MDIDAQSGKAHCHREDQRQAQGMKEATGMKSAYDILKERGFVEQITDEALITELFAKGPVTCYIGFDPTATSLHIGSSGSHYGAGAHAAKRQPAYRTGRRRHRP